MHNEDGRADQATDQHHDTGQPTQLGIGRSLRPGTGVPPRVLVADMGDGSLFLQGWRDGPSAHLSPADAVPLRRELAAAFGGTELAVRGEQGEAWWRGAVIEGEILIGGSLTLPARTVEPTGQR